MIFGTTNAERMRLDTSGNLGIGTSSPAYKLDIAGGHSRIRGAYAQFWFNSDDTNYVDIYNSGATGANNGVMAFETNGSIKMRLDASGNLGLGVTPSAWDATGSGGPVLQIKRGLLFGADSETRLIHNAYYGTGDFRYIATSVAATNYQQASGQHRWYNAPSGTAGNAITFTQAMTLGSGGNLLLGLTSASLGTRLEVKSSNSQLAGFISSDANGTSYEVRGSAGKISHYATYATSAIDCYHAWFTTASSGAQTQSMTLDASGNLLVGTTSATTLTTNCVVARVTQGTVYAAHENGNTGSNFAVFVYDGTTIGSISQSGTTAVLYNVTSDQRLKENIVDAPEFGSVIDSLQVRSFDWKTDQTHQRAGFVAQELVTVAPEAVYQPADPEEMMAVDYSKLVPMLVKEIQSLRVRVAQLETN
jgi:hypothetical protein